jgi:hypothetical protein
MKVKYGMYEIERNVCYIKWFIIRENKWDDENKELLRQEISKDFQEQFGGHQVY